MFIEKDKLVNFSNECFIKLGMPEQEANTITEVMLEADLREIHSHGFLRLPIYIERIQNGLILNKANISLINNHGATALMDGNYSAGQVVAKEAMEKSIALAEEFGIGLVSVKNSNHFGITAYYSLMAAKQDKVGIVISNVAPLMPAIGGKEKVIGNNPISIAAPSIKEPIVLDMALSNTAFGKVLFHKENNKEIPTDWGVDRNGVPTSNPDDIINGGFLSPVGGPKGFGLAVMAEILTGILSGGDFSKMIPSMYDLENKQSISHFMLTIDIKKLIPLELYYSNIEQLTNYIKNSSKADGIKDIYLPGEIEFMKERENETRGIPIEDNLIDQLDELANVLKIQKLSIQ